MRLDRRLIILGTIIVVLSMSMATQYATTRATFSFAIVHPSDADIRYIASDFSSNDTKRVYRVNDNVSGPFTATIELGNWMPWSTKNYTAAFGIVNEEPFTVNITHIRVEGTNASYMSIWLHGNRTKDFHEDASSVMVVDAGVAQFDSGDVVWRLGDGDGDSTSMNGGAIPTPWEDTSGVRVSVNNTEAVNGTSDFVWVGISLIIDSDAELTTGKTTGTIFIHFEASTLD